MNYECKVCGAVTAMTGPCRGCSTPAMVEDRPTRRVGKSEIERLTAQVATLTAECDRLRALNGDWAMTAAETLADRDSLAARLANKTIERDACATEMDRAHGEMKAAKALANIADGCRASAEREAERLRALVVEACEIGQRHTRALRSIMPGADRVVADDARIAAIRAEAGKAPDPDDCDPRLVADVNANAWRGK